MPRQSIPLATISNIQARVLKIEFSRECNGYSQKIPSPGTVEVFRTVGDIMSTVGDTQNRRGIMMHVGMS